MKAIASITALLAAVAMSGLAYADPTFSCDDGARITKGIYDRTMETRVRRGNAHAEYLAESFWRVAGVFAMCKEVQTLGSAMVKIYRADTKGGDSGSTIGVSTQVTGQAGDTNFSGLTVAVASSGGTSVVNGKTIPGAMLVDGIAYVPEAKVDAARAMAWDVKPDVLMSVKKKNPNVDLDKILGDIKRQSSVSAHAR